MAAIKAQLMLQDPIQASDMTNLQKLLRYELKRRGKTPNSPESTSVDTLAVPDLQSKIYSDVKQMISYPGYKAIKEPTEMLSRDVCQSYIDTVLSLYEQIVPQK